MSVGRMWPVAVRVAAVVIHGPLSSRPAMNTNCVTKMYLHKTGVNTACQITETVQLLCSTFYPRFGGLSHSIPSNALPLDSIRGLPDLAHRPLEICDICFHPSGIPADQHYNVCVRCHPSPLQLSNVYRWCAVCCRLCHQFRLCTFSSAIVVAMGSTANFALPCFYI